MKQTGEKSALESPPAMARAALNETIMSRLDLSCFMKARRKGFAKAPLLENANPAKYARFVSHFLSSSIGKQRDKGGECLLRLYLFLNYFLT